MATWWKPTRERRVLRGAGAYTLCCRAVRGGMRGSTGGKEVSKVVVRPVMAVATRPRTPEVAWRIKTANAAAPRTRESRTTRKVPEDLRPESYEPYWVVIVVWMLLL